MEDLPFEDWPAQDVDTILSAKCCMLRRPRRHVIASLISQIAIEKCVAAELELDEYKFLTEKFLRLASLADTSSTAKIRQISAHELRDPFGRLRLPTVIHGAIKEWPGLNKWVREDGTINPDGLEATFGRDTEVPVEFSDGSRRRLRLGDFLDQWRQSINVGYLKDFIFKKKHTADAPTPSVFRGYRNWLSDDQDIGYNFLYLGPRGSCTRLHCDVANSISWSASLSGRKLWRFVPPHYTHLLYDASGRHLARDLPPLDHESFSPWYSPCRCDSALLRCFPSIARIQTLEFIQEPGQVIFVPSGWYHTVKNLDPALSVNANVLNACNSLYVLSRLETLEVPSDALFGGDNLSADSFCTVLLQSIRNDLKLSDQASHRVSFQIQRAAAMIRILIALGYLLSPSKIEKSASALLARADALLCSSHITTSLILADSFLLRFRQRQRLSGVNFVGADDETICSAESANINSPGLEATKVITFTANASYLENDEPLYEF